MTFRPLYRHIAGEVRKTYTHIIAIACWVKHKLICSQERFQIREIAPGGIIWSTLGKPSPDGSDLSNAEECHGKSFHGRIVVIVLLIISIVFVLVFAVLKFMR